MFFHEIDNQYCLTYGRKHKKNNMFSHLLFIQDIKLMASVYQQMCELNDKYNKIQ